MALRLFIGFGGIAALLLSASMALAAQWSTAVPGLHRWTQADRIPRHRAVAKDGVPEPYRSMRNPLPASPETVATGEAVYAANCRSCHGSAGKGDGGQGHDLSPAPFDIAWLSEMKLSRFDGFMYWTIAEGGAPFGTAMPGYSKSLTADQIWAATAYIQAGLPAKRQPAR